MTYITGVGRHKTFYDSHEYIYTHTKILLVGWLSSLNRINVCMYYMLYVIYRQDRIDDDHSVTEQFIHSFSF